MIPRRPSLPSTISRTLGPVEVLGTGRMTSSPAGVTTRRPRVDVGDVAVAVGLHARGARRDPAAERRVGEGVGVVAEGPAARVELLLQARAVDAGLHARQPRGLVDARAAASMRARSTETTVRVSSARRLEAARDARAAAERDHDRVGVERGAQDLGHLGLVAGPHDDVGDPAELAAALADEVAQALAAGVDDAVVGIVGDVRLADRALERGAQVAGSAAARGRRARRSRAGASEVRSTSIPRCSRMNGAKPGLSSWRERDALVAPAPPLHRGRGRRSCRHRGHGLDITRSVRFRRRGGLGSSGGGTRTHNLSVNSRSLCH